MGQNIETRLEDEEKNNLTTKPQLPCERVREINFQKLAI